MKKLNILVGLSGAGKSTWRNKYVYENPGTLVLCRDSLREALTGLSAAEYNQHPITFVENTISDLIEAITYDWVERGKKDLIIDQTNLRKRYIDQHLKHTLGQVKTELILIDTPLDVCKQRVVERDGILYPDYIEKQAKQLEEIKRQITFDKIISYETIEIGEQH